MKTALRRSMRRSSRVGWRFRRRAVERPLFPRRGPLRGADSFLVLSWRSPRRSSWLESTT